LHSDKELDEAVDYVEKQGIVLFGINENKDQLSWTNSPKAYCHMYIDDAALGCPLIDNGFEKRPFVDWKAVSDILLIKNIIY